MNYRSFLIRTVNILLNRKHRGTLSDASQAGSQDGSEIDSGDGSLNGSQGKSRAASSPAKQSRGRKSNQKALKDLPSSNGNNPTESKQVSFTPSSIMRSLGVEILQDGGDGYYLVAFQGSVFMMIFEDDRVNIMYNDVAECSFDDTVKASLVASEINSTYAVWSCYLRTVQKGTSRYPVKVCFSQMFPLKGDFEQLTQFIHGVMCSAFTIGRDFRDRLKKAQKDNSNLGSTLIQKDFVYKLELAKRMMEVQNYDEIKDEKPSISYLRIDALADLFNDTSFGEPLSMNLLVDGKIDVISEKESVVNFDLRDYIRKYPNRENLATLTAIVVFEKQDLVINMKRMPGSSVNSLFFALNVMRSGVQDDIISGDRAVISFRDTIEIRLTTNQEDYWEVKYMLDEAREKHKTSDVLSLTNQQKMMLIQLFPNVQDDLYWGFKFFNQDCLFQSLYYFKRIYYNLTANGETDANSDGNLAEICLYIGIIYSRMNHYELAYYYLDRSNKNDSIVASEWYVNCLCELNDSRVYRYIRRMINVSSNSLESSEIDKGKRAKVLDYYLFLKRRLLQKLIKDARFTEAEHLAMKMIKRGENVEFCKKELGVLNKIREEIYKDSQTN